MQDRPSSNAPQGPRALAELAMKLAEKPLGQRGFSAAAMIADWPLIVGEAQALGSLPVKIQFPPQERANGVLHVRVVSGGMALEFKHREPLIVQRINGYFGYGAVRALKITQGAVPPRPPRKRAKEPPQLSATQQAELNRQLEKVEDEEIRAALLRLGRHLRKSGSEPKQEE